MSNSSADHDMPQVDHLSTVLLYHKPSYCITPDVYWKPSWNVTLIW